MSDFFFDDFKFRRHNQHIGMLDAFFIASTGVQNVALHCDDFARACHLEMEVGVVGHHHELGVAS